MSGATDAPAKKPRRKRPDGPPVPDVSPEARKIAASILEVLGGVRTPSDAAAALGCSAPRYYALEARAVAALVASCEPRKSRGRKRSPEREVEVLKESVARLERECARHQSLLRTTQRTIGLSPPAAAKKPAPGKRRPKKPRARALAAAKALVAGPTSNEPTTGPTPAND